jgi:hypothetical protein
MTVSSNVRVLIATTTGDPVEIEKLFKLPADLEMSVACVGGGSTKAAISDSYDHFVAAGSGIIEQRFGHRSWRLELSSSIHAGRSWQLGVFIAHELKNAGRLAERGEPADTIIVATGEVHHDVSVARIDGLAAKLSCLIKFLTDHPAPESHLIIAWPKSNQADADDATRQKLKELGATIIELGEVGPLIDELGVAVKAGQSTIVNPVAPSPLDEIEASINERLRQVHAEWTGIFTAVARFLQGTIRTLWIVLKTMVLALALTVNAAWKSTVVTVNAAWKSIVFTVGVVWISIWALAAGALFVWKYKSVLVAAAWIGCNFVHEACIDLIKQTDKGPPIDSERAHPLHIDATELIESQLCSAFEHYDYKLKKCVAGTVSDKGISIFMPRTCSALEYYDSKLEKCTPSYARRLGLPDCSLNEHYDSKLEKCVADCSAIENYLGECVRSGIVARPRGFNVDPSPAESKGALPTDQPCPPLQRYNVFNQCVPIIQLRKDGTTTIEPRVRRQPFGGLDLLKQSVPDPDFGGLAEPSLKNDDLRNTK